MWNLQAGHLILTLALVMALGSQLPADPLRENTDTKQLIEQLVSEDVPTQDYAIETLEKRDLEVTVIPLLKSAAESNNLKGQHAAFKLLVRLAKPDNEPGQAARAALTELSQSTKPQIVAAANKALRALEPAAAPAAGNQNPGLPPGLLLNGPRMAGRVFESVTISMVNGQRQIHVKNQDRKIDIQDKDGKEIEMKVTENAGGKETTYTAKDLDDLKAKHADVAPLYEKYTQVRKGLPGAGGLPGIQMQIQQNGLLIPGVGGNAAEANKQIESSLGRLAKVKSALEALDKETFDKEQVQGLLEELEAAKKDLFAAQGQLGMP